MGGSESATCRKSWLLEPLEPDGVDEGLEALSCCPLPLEPGDVVPDEGGEEVEAPASAGFFTLGFMSPVLRD